MRSRNASPSPESPPKSTVQQDTTPLKRPVLVAAVLVFSSLVVSLMQSLMLPIQSDLPRLLNTSADNASWVITSTLLGSAVAMPIAGKLADMYGKKPVLVATSAILLVGSLLCALFDQLSLVLIGRVLQGVAMGYLPVAMSFVRQVLPKPMVNSTMAAVSASLGVGGALGVPISAWIAQQFNWHILFWITAVLATAMLALAVAALPHIRTSASGRIDVVGSIILVIGLVSFLVGISKGGTWGWSSVPTVTLIVFGLVVLPLWGLYELRLDNPLVDLRTTVKKPVLLTNLAALLIGFGLMGHNVVIPQLLQLPTETGLGMGQTIMQAGLWLAPGAMMMLVLAPVSSRLLTRFGAKSALGIGAVVLTLGYGSATLFMDAPWQLMIASAIASAGVGIGYAAMPTLIMENVPAHEAGSAVGVNALMRSLGSTVAAAVMTGVMTSNLVTTGGIMAPARDAFTLSFIVGAVAALGAVLFVLLVPRGADSAAAADSPSGAEEGQDADRELVSV
ncbi:MFS transporter [Timonella senegalensis]|uniref:MFS transporter n=2 Tax=Timonella senegalensis TaxID=1465825 RepID=UPI002FDD36C2